MQFGWGSDGQPRVAKYREPHDFLLAIIVTWRYQEKPPKNNYEDMEFQISLMLASPPFVIDQHKHREFLLH